MDDHTDTSRFHRVILAQGASILLVFALLTCGSLFLFRSEIRQQILNRDGIIL